MPIDDTGFYRGTLDDFETEFRSLFEAKFTEGDDVPSTDPESPFGILSSVFAAFKNSVYEDVEGCYYSNFITTASGVALERLAYPLLRRNATYATATQEFSGSEGQIIPSGFIVETEDSRQYETLSGGTIGVSGILTLTVQSILPGLGQNAPISAIRFIPFPLPGLDSAINTTPAQGGLDIETESDFRTKVISIRSADLTSSLEAIVNRVKQVSGVIDAFGVENVGTDIDSAGRPPGSFEIIVEGGTDLDIATAIYGGKSAGVETTGDISVVITDSVGGFHTMYFSRVVNLEVYIKVTLTTTPAYDSAVEEPKIRQRILEYIGGVDQQSITYQGTGIGETVYSWKASASLFDLDEISTIAGVAGVTVLLGLSMGTETLTEIVPEPNERAFTDFANITIVEA